MSKLAYVNRLLYIFPHPNYSKHIRNNFSKYNIFHPDAYRLPPTVWKKHKGVPGWSYYLMFVYFSLPKNYYVYAFDSDCPYGKIGFAIKGNIKWDLTVVNGRVEKGLIFGCKGRVTLILESLIQRMPTGPYCYCSAVRSPIRLSVYQWIQPTDRQTES